ncbi:hypothetical protein JCM14635_06210 [Megalodesulfovibrio paquesii]
MVGQGAEWLAEAWLVLAGDDEMLRGSYHGKVHGDNCITLHIWRNSLHHTPHEKNVIICKVLKMH